MKSILKLLLILDLNDNELNMNKLHICTYTQYENMYIFESVMIIMFKLKSVSKTNEIWTFTLLLLDASYLEPTLNLMIVKIILYEIFIRFGTTRIENEFVSFLVTNR